MNRIRKGDQVVVIAGKNKGQKGEVLRVVGDQSSCRTSTGQAPHEAESAGQPAGRHRRARGFDHVSNVMLFNPAATGKGERVGFKTLEDGRKVRVFRRPAKLSTP
jgi:large subunit ribosomal protein L24